jgi:hypothetical protein
MRSSCTARSRADDSRAARVRAFIHDVRSGVQLDEGQACSGEAAFDEARLVLNLQAGPDDLDQAAEAGGSLSQSPARDRGAGMTGAGP